MHDYIYQDTDEAEEDETDTAPMIALPYKFSVCLSLWSAWGKGIMPKAGGFFDQPRDWQRMIGLFNQRHNRIFRQYMDENGRAPADRRERDTLGEDYEGMFSGFVDAPKQGFDDLMRG